MITVFVCVRYKLGQTKIGNQKLPFGGAFYWLHAGDVHGTGSFGGVLDFEGHSIAFSKVVELSVREGVTMEEHVFGLSFRGDKPETTIGEFLDNTIHRLWIR